MAARHLRWSAGAALPALFADSAVDIAELAERAQGPRWLGCGVAMMIGEEVEHRAGRPLERAARASVT